MGGDPTGVLTYGGCKRARTRRSACSSATARPLEGVGKVSGTIIVAY